MAVYKLSIDDFEDLDYELIAVYTTLEDFRFAFMVNEKLSTRFKRDGKGISLNQEEELINFSKFIFEDLSSDLYWTIVQNKIWSSSSNSKSLELFNNTIEQKKYLFPELKNVDYFIKIENLDSRFNLDEVINKLNEIDNVTVAHTVNIDQIKSKNNLIF